MYVLKYLGVSNIELRLLVTLMAASATSCLLLGLRIITTGTDRYWFMFWNLFLAWLPLLFAVLLRKWLKNNSWQSWQGITLTGLWVLLLPNSFYVLSDLIHLRPTGDISLLYDALLLFSFTVNGFIVGFISVYLVHQQFIKRLKYKQTLMLIGLVFLLCGFAVYLGRSLRWNSWDIFIHPAGILFDVSNELINPLAHPQVVITTLTFFMLLCSLYAVAYQVVSVASNSSKNS